MQARLRNLAVAEVDSAALISSPQLLLSAARDTQAALQTSGRALGHLQAPLTQVAPAGHAVLHVPAADERTPAACFSTSILSPAATRAGAERNCSPHEPTSVARSTQEPSQQVGLAPMHLPPHRSAGAAARAGGDEGGDHSSIEEQCCGAVPLHFAHNSRFLQLPAWHSGHCFGSAHVPSSARHGWQQSLAAPSAGRAPTGRHPQWVVPSAAERATPAQHQR